MRPAAGAPDSLGLEKPLFQPPGPGVQMTQGVKHLSP